MIVTQVLPQLSNAACRSDLQYILIACRSKAEQMVMPYLYFSDSAPDFTSQTLNVQLTQLACQFEAYCVNHNGIHGTYIIL